MPGSTWQLCSHAPRVQRRLDFTIALRTDTNIDCSEAASHRLEAVSLPVSTVSPIFQVQG